jgi:hypothetical protein
VDFSWLGPILLGTLFVMVFSFWAPYLFNDPPQSFFWVRLDGFGRVNQVWSTHVQCYS